MTLMASESNSGDGIRAISLFSGLGGLDIGLHQAGVDTLVCVENDAAAAQTLRINSNRHDDEPPESHISVDKRYPWWVIEKDIREVTDTEIIEAAGVERADVDFLVGGPPCQTFSRSNEGNRSGTETERGKLFKEYSRILHTIQPSAFLFENVRGLESSNGGEDLKEILSHLSGDTYRIDYRVLNAADYGVPQTRQRLLIIGTKSEEPEFPEPTHCEDGNDGRSEWVTAGEALSEFEVDKTIEENGGYTNAIGSKYGPVLKDIPEGANYQHFSERRYDPEEEEYVDRDRSEMDEKLFEWRSRHWNYLLKMDRKRPSWTIQAAPGSTVGPFHWRSRKLSILEQMKFMTLPLDYYISGKPLQIQSQVGNAVPPELAKAVAEKMLESLNLETEKPESRATPQPAGSNTRPSGTPPFTVEITNDRSPWHHADRLLHALLSEEAVVVKAEQSAIPNAVDAIEISRRHFGEQIRVEIQEEVREGEDWKGGYASVLHAHALTGDTKIELASPPIAT